jgi:ATP-dependent DNA helicase RecG
VREALVNAVAHRDYRLPSPVVVEHSPSQLVVVSPGELVFGVTEQNLLTHTSKPRNRALTEALRVLRLAERAGTGVDTMVRAMIRAGHAPPAFQSRDGYVRVVLTGGPPVTRVAALIASLPRTPSS